MGVRISWLMFARNSVLARFAASAASRAAERASWARTCSVTSRWEVKKPRIRPSPSLWQTLSRSTQTGVPSIR